MDILEWVKKQTGKLADNVKDYKFYVKNQPNFIDSSTTLILTTYANRDELATIPCVFKWSRIKNGLLSQVPQFKGNSFICQPSDIGCIIQVQITSTDGMHPGTAVLKYGPVKLDVLIKKQVQHALTSGSSVMNVDLVQKDQAKQCQLKITEESIKISHSNSNNSYTFDYTLGQPRIQASIRQPNRVQIYFNQKYDADVTKFTNAMFGFQQLTSSLKQSNEKKLQIRFPNRSTKDNFLLIVKAFNTKKAMKTSAIIAKLQNVDLTGNQNFNYVLEIESLRADLIKLARLNDKFIADKRNVYEENRKLEKQIQEIIVTYTKIVQGKCKNKTELDQSVMELFDKKDEVMQRKLHSLMRENETLKDRIEEMNEDAYSKSSQYGGEGGAIRKNNSGSETPISQSRGGFIKKRTVPEVPANQFEPILDSLNNSEIKQNPNGDGPKTIQQEKAYLAKKLNESIVKIAKLQDKVKELKLNQTSLNIDNPNNMSSMSIQSNKKLNMTAMELGQKEKEKFMAEIDQLRKRNMKLRQENVKLKSDTSYYQSGQQKVVMEDNRSERSKAPSVVSKSPSIASKSQNLPLNPQLPKAVSDLEKQLQKKIDDLTKENQNLKEQIQRLTIEKDIILKQKAAVEEKYKKRMGDLKNQNSMYKRNQDALNRSQNISMQMQSFNEQQSKLLKDQNQFLTTENLKITKLYQKSMEQLKQVPKMRQQIMKLTAELQQFTGGKNFDISMSKNEESMHSAVNN